MLPTARPLLIYPTTPGYRADTTAWLAASSSPGSYSTASKTALDNYLASLDSNELLKFDRLWLYHFAENAADSMRCIVSRQLSTTASMPMFTRRQGWQFSLTLASYINTNWAPNSGSFFQTNDASLILYCRAFTGATNIFRAIAGCVDNPNTNGIGIGALSNVSGALARINVNGTPAATAAIAPGTGQYMSLSRLSTDNYVGRKGSTEETITAASSGRCSLNLYIGARNLYGNRDGQNDNQESLVAVGAGQTFAQYTTFRNITNTFHTAIGFT